MRGCQKEAPKKAYDRVVETVVLHEEIRSKKVTVGGETGAESDSFGLVGEEISDSGSGGILCGLICSVSKLVGV